MDAVQRRPKENITLRNHRHVLGGKAGRQFSLRRGLMAQYLFDDPSSNPRSRDSLLFEGQESNG